MSQKVTQDRVEAEIADLENLDLKALRARWQDLTGKPAPKFFRRKFLMRAVAYQLQVAVFGGLDAATKRRLREIANAVKEGKDIASLSRVPIKPGTRLVRDWRGVVHTVTVQPECFEWNGARYQSLSAIAKAITGTNWNGYAFFGLRQSRKTTTKNAEHIHGG